MSKRRTIFIAAIFILTCVILLIHYDNDDASKAKKQVLQYFELLEQAFTKNVSEQEWRGVLSKAALTSVRGPQLEKYLIGCTLSYPRLNIWHKEVFTVIKEQGNWVIDSSQEKLRHPSDLPRYALDREEAVALERNWQRNNHYTEKEILELNRTLIGPALRLVYASHNWDGPVENMSPEHQAEYHQVIQRSFLPEVINSHGWDTFIAITARYDPFSRSCRRFPMKIPFN